MKRQQWITFAVVQFLGATLSMLGGHGNPLPYLFGLLLMPGVLVIFVFERLRWLEALSIAIPVNGLCWWLFARLARLRDIPKVEGS